MGTTQGEGGGTVHFDVGEVVEIKGWLFKIVLVDAFTNKICMKRVSPLEAQEIKAASTGAS